MSASSPLNIAVLAGGYSGEADVSRRSAAMVMAHMDPNRYQAYLVHIERDGWWAEDPASGERIAVDKDTLGYISPKAKPSKRTSRSSWSMGHPEKMACFRLTST